MEKSISNFIQKYWHVIFLVGILLISAYLRLYNIKGYMTFLGDEGRDVLVVKRMIVDHKFTLLGPTASVGGFFLGPLYYYLMLPFLWAWGLNPVGPAVMVALFGIATVYLVYMIGNKMFDRWTAIFASSLYALSPIIIAYSRSSWNPNLVPFFALLLIFFLWNLISQRNISNAFFIGVLLGIGLQMHYLFLFLFVLVLLWCLFEIRKLPIVFVLIAMMGGFLVGYAPFLAFEVRHGFPNTQSVVRFVLAGKDTGLQTGSFFTIVSDVIFRLFGRLLVRFPDKAAWNLFSPWQMEIWTMLVKTIAYISTLFILYNAMYQAGKKYFFLFTWLAVPVILFGFYHKGIYDYYFGMLFALPFLFLSIVGARFMKGRITRWIVLGIWIVLCIFNWQGRPFVYPPNNQLEQAKTIARVAFEKTNGKPFNFALITGGNSDHAYRYFFEIWGNKPVIIENDTVDPERKTVTDQLLVICEDPKCQPLGNSLWEVAGFGRAEITGFWDVPFVRIYRLVHYQGST